MVRAQVLSLVLVVAITAGAASYARADQTSVTERDRVSAATLKRTHTILPTWPESAAGVEGWVLLWFTLLPDGTVTDVEIKEAHPAGIFDTSAVEALRQWTFEPVEHDGKKIAQRAEIRMKYAQPK
ncbi:energy transducer TonB [Steroidobacter cummioxidans]|uniref:energy transducer TonB n=1 Tax=Steroidobacter cummioxidans TaxID=1803913 RepID=UPI0012907E87|nr:energy transducer TonB [Steroidobacter cummioxidans]